jgi:hypothetical protein
LRRSYADSQHVGRTAAGIDTMQVSIALQIMLNPEGVEWMYRAE